MSTGQSPSWFVPTPKNDLHTCSPPTSFAELGIDQSSPSWPHSRRETQTAPTPTQRARFGKRLTKRVENCSSPIQSSSFPEQGSGFHRVTHFEEDPLNGQACCTTGTRARQQDKGCRAQISAFAPPSNDMNEPSTSPKPLNLQIQQAWSVWATQDRAFLRPNARLDKEIGRNSDPLDSMAASPLQFRW